MSSLFMEMLDWQELFTRGARHGSLWHRLDFSVGLIQAHILGGSPS